MVKLKHEFGQNLQITWDTNVLKHLGIFVSQGYDSLNDGDFEGQLLLGLEPTTSIGDDLETCKNNGTLKILFPGQMVSFWVCFTLES